MSSHVPAPAKHAAGGRHQESRGWWPPRNPLPWCPLLLGLLLTRSALPATVETLDYSYDATDRLVRVLHGDGATVDYVYDNLGNRLVVTTTRPGAPANRPPGAVATPYPSNGAINASLNPTLSWRAAVDPDPGDTVMYLVYFGTVPDPPLVASGWPTNWLPGPLRGMTTYYWSVVARDSRNAETTGPVWSFTTSNAPPAPAFVATPTNGWAPLTVSFLDRSFSQDDAIASWEWDFDHDGAVDSMEQNPVWTYTSAGSYAVNLRVVDEHGAAASMTLPAFINVLDEGILDLQPRSLTLRGTESYRHVSLTYQVTNRGTVSIPAPVEWYDCFYVSTDAILDFWDEQVACVHERAIVSAGAVYARSNLVTLPGGIDGRHFLILVADGDQQIPEADEDNNWVAVSLNLAAPDLAPASVTAPAVVQAGRQATLTWSVTNRGSALAPAPWSDGVYLSQDDQWDPWLDQYLDGEWHQEPDLAANGSYRVTNTVSLPRLEPGTYYLICLADDSDTVFETSETNNWRAVPVTVELGAQPDLVPLTVTVPTPLLSGSQVELVWVVTNRGAGGATASWTDTIYLSTNAQPELWEATYLGTAWHEVDLAPGATYRETNVVQVPRLPPGQYYLTVSADAMDDLFESNEANNILSFPVHIELGLQPDLVPLTVTAPAPLLAGQQMELVWAVTNRGAGVATGAWYDGLYLSADDQFDSGLDEYLGAGWHEVDLPARGSYRETNLVQVPRWPPGPYYVLLITDQLDAVYESNETNNSLAFPVVIDLGAQSDLAPLAVTAPEVLRIGESAELTWAVTNRGAGAAEGSWLDAVYLSVDPQWDQSTDQFLAISSQMGPLAPAASYRSTSTVVVPEVEPGSYFLIAVVDLADGIFESSEINNLMAVPVTVSPGTGGGFRILRVEYQAASVLIEIVGESGRFYYLERSEDLQDWSMVGSPVFGTGSLVQLTDPGPGTQPWHFYRVVMIIFQ